MKTIKLKNNSTRLHHIGGISIIPGGEADVPEIYKDSYNKQDLELVSAEPKKANAFVPVPPVATKSTKPTE